MRKTGYDPRGVLTMLKNKGVAVPVGTNFGKKSTLTDAAGDPVYEAPKPIATCAFLLLAFTNGSQLVPDDFHGIEKSGKALKAYVRPDGGSYLGAFQVANEPDGVVVVFGDPATSTEEAQRVAMHYRTVLQERYAGEQALKDLGPFAGLQGDGSVTSSPDARQ